MRWCWPGSRVCRWWPARSTYPPGPRCCCASPSDHAAAAIRGRLGPVTTLARSWSARLAVTALVLAGCTLAPRPSADLALAATGTVDPLPIGTGWGPTAAEIDRARDLVAGADARRARRPGYRRVVHRHRPPTALVNELHLGGIVSFASNIATPRRCGRPTRRCRPRPPPPAGLPGGHRGRPGGRPRRPVDHRRDAFPHAS